MKGVKRGPFLSSRAQSCSDNWVDCLQAAVVLQAAMDYRLAIRAARGLRRHPNVSGRPDKYNYNVKRLYHWFRSAYGELLCGGNGVDIARRIEKEERYAECNID